MQENQSIQENISQGDRRNSGDRRKSSERRSDLRTIGEQKRSFKVWVKSLTNPRLGVDRRKGGDQRSPFSTQDMNIKSLLSPEELSELLK